jgi:hypothetical protein
MLPSMPNANSVPTRFFTDSNDGARRRESPKFVPGLSSFATSDIPRGLFCRKSDPRRIPMPFPFHIVAAVRRHVALATLLVAAIFIMAIVGQRAPSAETQSVASSAGRAQQVAKLRDRLVFGLQARLPSEIAFVELVVEKVQTGKLPQRVVDQTFFWARDRASISRNGSSRRPIIFFQPAMKARAKRLRVVL